VGFDAARDVGVDDATGDAIGRTMFGEDRTGVREAWMWGEALVGLCVVTVEGRMPDDDPTDVTEPDDDRRDAGALPPSM